MTVASLWVRRLEWVDREAVTWKVTRFGAVFEDVEAMPATLRGWGGAW